jgi:hypothetical protein
MYSSPALELVCRVTEVVYFDMSRPMTSVRKDNAFSSEVLVEASLLGT